MLKKLKGSYIDGTSTIFKESEHNFFFFFFFDRVQEYLKRVVV